MKIINRQTVFCLKLLKHVKTIRFSMQNGLEVKCSLLNIMIKALKVSTLQHLVPVSNVIRAVFSLMTRRRTSHIYSCNVIIK